MDLGNLISETEFILSPPGWLFRRSARLKRFENGFSLSGTKQPEVLARYDEMPAFSEQRVSYFLESIPTGIKYYFQFAWPTATSKLVGYTLEIPAEGSVWKGTLRNPSSHPELEALKSDLSYGIASRMIRDFNAGQIVQWIPDVFLCPDGVEFRSAKTPGIMPYAEIDSCEMQVDNLCLRSSSASLRMLNIPLAALNFHPGLRVLQSILNSAA